MQSNALVDPTLLIFMAKFHDLKKMRSFPNCVKNDLRLSELNVRGNGVLEIFVR